MKNSSMISHKVIAIKLVVVFVLCVCAWGEVGVRCIEREREALLSFKYGLVDEYGILSSWRTDECCNWYGVECSNTTTAHVISLNLNADSYELGGNVEYTPRANGDTFNILRGNVGSSLLELSNLKYLGLSYNDFGGDRIPEFIGSMKQLEELYLSYSNFSGTFPPQIGNLTNLIVLDLSYNSLRSRNLDWLSGLSSLIFLDLSYSFDLSETNSLQHILSLRSLKRLLAKYCNIRDANFEASSGLFVNSSSTSLLGIDLSHNQISSSTIFHWLSNITTLLEVSLWHNALRGQIPNSFERLILLQYLDLSDNMLEGEIPKSLGNLSQLKILFLYNNQIRGHLDEFFENASVNGTLASLEILDLGHNQLNGSVPDLRAFSALRELYLNRNRLTGSVPPTLGQLSNLHVLHVSDNYLEGTVSESHLINLENLKVLDISFNSLTMEIAPDWNPPFQLDILILGGCKMGPHFPKWIQTQRNISVLDLSGAGIIELPKWLWSFSPSLEFLSLSNNQINGTMPDLSSTPILNIDASSNNISGPIPLFHPNTNSMQLSQNLFFGSISSLCEIPHDSLYFLDLSENKLTGEIPNCWEKIPYLFYLKLSFNSFSGQIPHSLGSLYYLNLLQLHGNSLSGELPSTLRFCKQLGSIDVGGNELTGYIPSWLAYTDITRLNIQRNRFYGSIPPEICNLAGLQVLDLSRNNLSGEIPNCFNNFISLAQRNTTVSLFVGYRYSSRYNPLLTHLSFAVDFSQSLILKWKGQESEYLMNLRLLKLIDLSSNRLTGNIPKSFSSMKALISLNLSRNCLTGNIIPDIGQMEMLDSLDLSNNKLSGQIPASLANLNFLSVLDLSNNNLSGKIPSSTQLQSMDISRYAGNNGLCGPPLALCPQDRQRPTQGEKENWFWRLSFMQGFAISIAFGFIVGFWGVVGSFVLKKSWRYGYFKFLDAAGDWLYVRTTLFLSKFGRR